MLICLVDRARRRQPPDNFPRQCPLSSNRACSRTDTGRPASPHFAYVPGLKVREEGEHYFPDPPRRADDEEYQVEPELSDAARAHTGNVGRALKHLDDAMSLVGVLLDAVERDNGTRSVQARTVLEMAVECIHEAHRCVGDLEEVI